MTSAPRWNTHAIIALARPLRIQHGLRIHTAPADAAARSWTVVVHHEPSHRIVASVGSLDTRRDGSWHAIDLPPGRHRLALRYYQWSAPVDLPAVEVDGTLAVPERRIPSSTNDFYRDLASHSGVWYPCQHSYLRTLLRLCRWLPAASSSGSTYRPAIHKRHSTMGILGLVRGWPSRRHPG
jgi:hypothetical protein